MNKLEFKDIKTIKKEIELEQGDIVHIDGEGLFIIVNAGLFNDEMELHYRLIDLETGNRWDDNTYSLEDILEYIKVHNLQVYRNSKIKVELGEKII